MCQSLHIGRIQHEGCGRVSCARKPACEIEASQVRDSLCCVQRLLWILCISGDEVPEMGNALQHILGSLGILAGLIHSAFRDAELMGVRHHSCKDAPNLAFICNSSAFQFYNQS